MRKMLVLWIKISADISKKWGLWIQMQFVGVLLTFMHQAAFFFALMIC